jgi:TolB-like protein/Tfp pilus assembly protein PilF
MSSLISGFECDIFISYLQKDNKHDGWVTEFVRNLKGELESTFKEEISVYFDISPHDGLLETHDVGASLKEKLRCLIFIPIISQTYCDPKSFAWQHEFVAFNKMAREDKFGRDIRLTGGNVASRILPVKIHDLDEEDNTLLENELGGILRSIEFIYKSLGVNRPLRANEDRPQDNLNKTYYRDQINKVAKAVKEIITALEKQALSEGEVIKKVTGAKINSTKKLNLKLLIGVFLILGLILLGFFLIPKLSVQYKPDEKSIAILPFENLSNDDENSWLGNAISFEVRKQLNYISGIIVRPIDSFYQNNRSDKSIAKIGKDLNANYLLNGSTARFGDQIRISVNLSNTLTNTEIWNEQFECDTKDFQITQIELAKKLAYKLKNVLSPEEVSRIDKKMTDKPEAYKLYARGNEYMGRNFKVEERLTAIQLYERAIEIDPGFCMAYMQLAMCHLVLYWYGYDSSVERLKRCKEAMDAAFKVDPEVLDTPEAHISLANYYYMGFLNYSKSLEEISIAEKLSKNGLEYYDLKANIYRRNGDWGLAKENYQKAVEGSPNSPIAAHNTAVTYFLLGEYQKSETYFKSASILNPAYPEPYWQRILMHMKWEGNTIKSREILSEAFQFTENLNDAKLFESSILMDIYDCNYESALAYLSSKDISVISTPMHINLSSLLYARIYNLMNLPDKALACFDSARISIESRILKTPDDSKLFSALGIAYAGLGQKGKAIEAGAKAVSLMPISKDAYFGVYRIEDLARIFVMVGEYNKAIDQVKLLLSIPGPISKKMLLLDQTWKPLWDMPEFKKILRKAPADNSRI